MSTRWSPIGWVVNENCPRCGFHIQQESRTKMTVEVRCKKCNLLQAYEPRPLLSTAPSPAKPPHPVKEPPATRVRDVAEKRPTRRGFAVVGFMFTIFLALGFVLPAVATSMGLQGTNTDIQVGAGVGLLAGGVLLGVGLLKLRQHYDGTDGKGFTKLPWLGALLGAFLGTRLTAGIVQTSHTPIVDPVVWTGYVFLPFPFSGPQSVPVAPLVPGFEDSFFLIGLAAAFFSLAVLWNGRGTEHLTQAWGFLILIFGTCLVVLSTLLILLAPTLAPAVATRPAYPDVRHDTSLSILSFIIAIISATIIAKWVREPGN